MAGEGEISQTRLEGQRVLEELERLVQHSTDQHEDEVQDWELEDPRQDHL